MTYCKQVYPTRYESRRSSKHKINKQEYKKYSQNDFNMRPLAILNLRGLIIMGSFKSTCRNARNQVKTHQDHSWSFSVRLLQLLRLVHQLHFGTPVFSTLGIMPSEFWYICFTLPHFTFGTLIGTLFLLVHQVAFWHTGIIHGHFWHVWYSQYVWYTSCVGHTEDRICVQQIRDHLHVVSVGRFVASLYVHFTLYKLQLNPQLRYN